MTETTTNAAAYRFLMQQKELIEREHAAHYQKHGNDETTCILKAQHQEACRKLSAVMEGEINA